jgi:monomeric sarcosine oxidase
LSARHVEVAVLGAGLMGAATAWSLARRGRSVALIEAFEIGHRNGSSHGSERIFRRAYPDPFYAELTGRAADCWRELELDSGSALLSMTGAVDTGDPRVRDPGVLAAAMTRAGVEHEVLTPEQAQERWPFMRFDGPVIHHAQAGTLDPDATIAACVRRAVELGAVVLSGTRVTGTELLGSGRVRVINDRIDLTADTLVLAAGAWLAELVPHLAVSAEGPLVLPPLTVVQKEVFHFRQRDPAAQWPTLVHKGPVQIYGLPSGRDGGAGPAVKVARYDGGPTTTASTRDGVIDPMARDSVCEFVRTRLPGLDPEPVAEASCLFTLAPNDDFILDRHGPYVIVSPCSGHGAKFAPLVGAIAADLAERRAGPPARFALPRQ